MTRIAIDFGSTNTKVAYFDEKVGKPRLLELGNRVRNIIPSLFYLPLNRGEPLVGNDAEESVESDPEGVISGLKKEIHKMGKIRRGPDRASPERIPLASQLFRHIRETCERGVLHGQTINECVLTVPATFEEAKQDSIRKAALEAGFEKVELIPEPVAAARYWLSTSGQRHNDSVVVCDIGGGTTDFAFVRNRNGNIEVVPEVLPGGVQEGGNDIDDNIFESLIDDYHDDAEILTKDRSSLIIKIRSARELFSRDKGRKETPISMGSRRIFLTREKVEACCAEFEKKVCESLAKYLDKCHRFLNSSKAFDLLLVGGGSRIPGMKQAIEAISKQPVIEWQDFEYAVVLGAINLAENKPKENHDNAENSKNADKIPKQIFDQDHKNPESGIPNTTDNETVNFAFQKKSQDDHPSKPEQNSADSNTNQSLTPTYKVDLGRGVKLELVLIPAGTFVMGSPESEECRGDDETRHEVTISKPFYLGKYPVTQAQWWAVMGKFPSAFEGPQLPVENVSWHEAVSFCDKIQKKTGQGVRLATEAEWEYACRAGTTTPFHFGSQLNGTQANCDGKYPYGTATKGPYLEKTSPVGSYPANGWGLHDMHGNVREWCSDWYGDYGNNRVTDPQGAPSGEFRVLRGGSWVDYSSRCRAACRERNVPYNSIRKNGFRVLLPLDRLTIQPNQDPSLDTTNIATDLERRWQDLIVKNRTKEELEKKSQQSQSVPTNTSKNDIEIPWGKLGFIALTLIRRIFFGG